MDSQTVESRKIDFFAQSAVSFGKLMSMQKVIPPFLFLFCAIAISLLDSYYPIQALLTNPYNFIGIIPLLIGVFMVVSTNKRFSKVKTQIHTFKKPKKLVTDGLFQYSRNPIYLGFSIALLGIALLFGNLSALIPVLLFFLVANFWYIPFEEKNMEMVFGQTYRFYKRRVRRWL
jgi:protein-S-isoprenylcysteine O-methyltransferase Ste14